ncbi:MAG: CinA family nicotinamide mononucleotide deamidase-related protein [Marinilabiliaceae bacterium]|nr:CinA family nicotinamide mononucleotide deamidase-related protein [Marinilabiliaceae bacterium]
MNIEIINIGDELLIGQVINTNSTWMSHELNKAGFNVSRIISVGDNESDILNVLKESTERSQIVLITGGLGPTPDDITMQTLCKFFNTRQVFNEEIYKDLLKMLKKRKISINQLTKEQAFVPENCEVIRNSVGTAPVLWFNHSEKIIASMPGVPFEMQYAMSVNIIPRLIKMFKTELIIHQTVNIFGIPESLLAEKISEWETNLPPFIKLAYLPEYGKIRLRLTATGNDKNTLEAAIFENIKMLFPLIADNIYGFRDETVQEMLLRFLKNYNGTISTAESCTGGYISHLITSVPGASECFKGSIVAYSNQLKTNLLDIKEKDLLKYGAVSKKVVEQMALSVCKKMGTDYAIATSGIAGPTGGSPQKPTGTVWIAWAGKGKVVSEKFQMGDDRQRTIIRTAETAIIKMKLMIELDHTDLSSE